MNNIIITVKKELRSIFRDKKTLSLLFIYPIMIPLMVILYGNIYNNMDTEENEYEIGLNYQVNESEKEILDSLNISYKNYSSLSEMGEAYEKKEIDGYISYDESKKQYDLYLDMSSSSGITVAESVNTYFEMYDDYLTKQYLINENVDIDKAYNHFALETIDLSDNNYMVTILLSVSLTYTILAICIATANMAVSATATEKENGTLETILTFPIKKTELILGKYFSAVFVGFVAALISIILMMISFYVGKNTYTVFENISLVINFKVALGAIVTIFAAAAFIAGISIALTAFAKSYKEAQGSASLVTVVGMVPMFVSILDIEISRAYYLIPVCNFEQVLNDLFTNSVNGINILIVLVSTLIYITLVIGYIIKAYNSEKILFTD